MDHDVLLLLLFLLLLFDRGSTAYAVRRWGWRHEVNPLFRRLFERGSRSQMLIVDAAVTSMIMALAWAVEEAAFVFVLCFAVVAINNVIAIACLIRSGTGQGSGPEAPTGH